MPNTLPKSLISTTSRSTGRYAIRFASNHSCSSFMLLLLYFSKLIFDGRFQTVGENSIDLFRRQVFPIFLWVGNVRHEDLEVGGELRGGVLDGFDSVPVVADDYRADAFRLEFVYLGAGDFLSERGDGDKAAVVIQVQFAGKGDHIEDALDEDDCVGLALCRGVVVVEQFHEVVLRGVAPPQDFVVAAVFGSAVMPVDFLFAPCMPGDVAYRIAGIDDGKDDVVVPAAVQPAAGPSGRGFRADAPVSSSNDRRRSSAS